MAVWPKAWRESALRMSINYHSCPNAPTQFAGLAALTGPQDSIRQMVASFDERRRYLHPALNALPGCSAALLRGAFYMMLDIEKTGIEGHVFQQELLHKAGVATVAGRSFGNVSLRQVRLSFASSMDNLKEAVRRIDAHLQQRLK